MSAKMTLEEIETQLEATFHMLWYDRLKLHAPRLLEICREQANEIASLRGDLAQADAALRSVP